MAALIRVGWIVIIAALAWPVATSAASPEAMVRAWVDHAPRGQVPASLMTADFVRELPAQSGKTREYLEGLGPVTATVREGVRDGGQLLIARHGARWSRWHTYINSNGQLSGIWFWTLSPAEGALAWTISSLMSGTPELGLYSQQMADHVVTNRERLQRDISGFGPAVAMQHVIGATYLVTHENGIVQWQVHLDSQGRVAGLWYKPQSVRRPAQVAQSDSLQATTVSALPAQASSGRRVALIIGNGGYDARLGALANPVRDAQLIASVLRATGFDVEVVTNADQRMMKRSIARLGERLTAAGRGATGLFFYAGHGLQSSRGVNFLAPIGAAIEREADIDIEAVQADLVLRQMEEAGAATSIMILDACRNVPIPRSVRALGAERGLARMDAIAGSFIAYSTAPGAVAADGAGVNSPFVTALAQEVQKPGQTIEDVFRNVRRSVANETGGRQIPWDSSSLMESFAFMGRP